MTDIRIMAKIAKLENARNENDRQHSKGEIGRQSKERVCFSLWASLCKLRYSTMVRDLKIRSGYM